MESGYQPYQYVAAGSVGSDINPVGQYIIVEDPTVIADKNHIQYVQQVQNDLEVMENVAGPVYDANSQQFFLDLNVPPDLVPMTVNTAPTVNHNVYGTNTGPPMEMVLTDKQCELFQQRGWILLEINDKIFLLDSTGLHDITDDHKLLSKLKNDSEMISMTERQPRCEMKDSVLSNELEGLNATICTDQAAYIQTEQMRMNFGNNIVQDNRPIQQLYETAEQERCEPKNTQDSSVQVEISQSKVETQTESDMSDSCDDDDTGSLQSYKSRRRITKGPVSEYHLKGNKLSKRLTAIDSEYRLKEIPREVILGKTASGKNLIARVLKGKGFHKRVRKSRREQRVAAEQESIVDENQLAELVEQVLLGKVEVCKQEDVSGADAVISQLLQVHEFKTGLHEHKLIVTKTIREKNEFGLIENQQGPILMTGRLVLKDGKRNFVYMPDLLQKHITLKDPDKTELENPEEDLFLHININEVKNADNISRVSVTVHKRYLSLNPVSSATEKNAIFPCNTCSRKFHTIKSLKRHQANKCLEIPFPEISFHEKQLYTILKTSNNPTQYKCNECKEKFVKRKDCLDHIQAQHTPPDEATVTAAKYLESFSDNKDQPLEHKCKLCTFSFSVASYLTDHIYEKHLTGNMTAKLCK